MILPQTENTGMKIWQEAGWKLVPFNVTIPVVDPITMLIDLKTSESEYPAPGGVLKITRTPNSRFIDTRTHEALLGQGLREYKDIWKTLAER